MSRRTGTGSAARRARGARAVGRVAALAVAAVAAVGLGVVPVAAQSPPPEPAPTGAAPGTGAAIDLVSQTPFVAPTDILRIDLDVRGAPDGAALTFTLRSPVTTPVGVGTAQERFDTWVDGTANLDADPFNSPKTFPVADLPPADGTGRINAAFQVVPKDQPEPLVGFQIEDPGVYPLTVSLTGPEGGAPLDLLTTYLVRLPTTAQAGPPLTVAPIVDLRAPVALRPDGSRSFAPSALDRIRTLVDALDATGTVPVSVDATPETLEALATTGPIPASGAAPAASATATTGPELLDRLEAALAERLVLGSTYVAVDVPAWTRSSMGAALAYQLSHGANVTEAVVPAAAPVDRRTWVADPALTPEALAELGRNGIDRVVLPETVVGPVDTRTAPDPERVQVASTQPFDVVDADGTAVRAVTADASLGQRLVATDDEALNAQILVADLAVTYLGALQPQINDIPDTPRGVAIEVPDDELALRSLVPFLDALATAPPVGGDGAAMVTAGTLDDLFSIPPATVAAGTTTDGTGERVLTRTVTPDPPPGAPEDMGDYPERLDAAELSLSAYESMVVDLDPGLVLPLRQLLDVSGAAGLDDTERDQYLDAATTATDAAFGQISIPEQDQVLLTVAETEIGIVIENGLAYPVTVRMDLASSKLDFPEGEVMEVVLAPGRNRVPVPVKTVSGGTFPLSIDVSTPDAREELGSGVVEVRSTAISGLGLALSIGAGFFLLVWWARNWRTTRRTTNAAAAAAAATRAAEAASDRAEHERERARAGFTVGPLDDLTADDPATTAGRGGRTTP